jgi:TrmH family RNA methyltransferase
MISKNEVKYIQSLCHKKNRQQEGLFLVEGEKIVDELLQGTFTIKRIYALQTWVDKHPAAPVAVTTVTEDELQKISTLQTANRCWPWWNSRNKNLQTSAA